MGFGFIIGHSAGIDTCVVYRYRRPLAFIGGFLFIIDLYLAKIFASLALGKILARQFGWKFQPAMTLTVGLLVYYLLRLVPVVGMFVRLLTLLAGLGEVWLYQKQLKSYKKCLKFKNKSFFIKRDELGRIFLLSTCRVQELSISAHPLLI